MRLPTAMNARSATGVSEPAGTSLGCVQIGNWLPHSSLKLLDHQLGNTFAPPDMKRLGWVGVDENHPKLASITTIDRAGTVERRDTVFGGQTRPRMYQRDVSIGQRNSDSGGDNGAAAASGNDDIDRRHQVSASIAGARIGGQCHVRVELDDRNVDHVHTLEGTYDGLMLVWMDLEMTGLEPDQHTIVEIATIVTDNDLNIVAEGPELVVHQPEDVLARMDDFVLKMHTRSGLIDQIRASTTSLETAGAETLAFIKQHVPVERTVPLCGNSIGTDRRFLDRYLPEIEHHLHYRCVDVSTIKELVRRWHPALMKQVPVKKTSHRALDDIKESIDELRFYRDNAFALPGRQL